VLCLPILERIDDVRASRLLERLLESIAARQAAEVLIDGPECSAQVRHASCSSGT
jgi:anti-anti-sigma regulatory factor